MYKLMKKMCIKSEDKDIFFKHATSEQSDKTFLSASLKNCHLGLSPLALVLYIQGIFLDLVQNDGNNKSFKMLPELVTSLGLYMYVLNVKQYTICLLFIRFTARAFRKLLSLFISSYFPFSFEGRMWDLIVSVPDHCLSFYSPF